MRALLNIVLIFIFFFTAVLINPFLWFISLFKKEDESIYYHTTRRFIPFENDCEKFWRTSFDSASEFAQFEKWIAKNFRPVGPTKHYQPKPKVRFLFYEYGAQNWEGGYIYECNQCNTLWELSEPDHAWRGYFKSINLNKEEIVSYLGK